MMKTATIAAVAGVVAADPSFGSKFEAMDLRHAFSEFVKKFKKSYETSEVFERFDQWRKNMKMIKEHDAQATGYTMAPNEFTDMSWDEFRKAHLGYAPRKRGYLRSLNTYEPEPNEQLAKSVDWVEEGVVTPVKNQGQCGSCWAFSTTGSTEGAVAIATGKLVSLSEQQLVDCAGKFGNEGCNGGLMDNGFEYIIEHGITSESSYEYTAKDGKCKRSVKSVAKITSYKDVAKGDEDSLKSAVAKGPVSVAIEADQPSFQHYSGGVFSGKCGEQLDHGVLLVGYGTDEESGMDYWRIKNSWGESWGDSGYINIVRDQNQCGISDSASFPIAGDSVSADDM